MAQTKDVFCDVCSAKRGVDPQLLEDVVILAVEIAREGREGRKIGTMFVVGDSEEVLKRSQPLIFDPLLGHPSEVKKLTNPDMRETVKELAQLDGAFVISNQGVVLSACRYLDASSAGTRLPLGLGSRHMAAAYVTRQTKAVAVVVSESSVVRVFDDGELVSEIIPELWLLDRHGHHLRGRYHRQTDKNLTVITKAD